MTAPERFYLGVCFIHVDGTRYYPVRVRDRDTGRCLFRVAKRGHRSNTKERTIFVEEESELLRFLKAGYGVRCGSLDGGPCNIYSINSRSIARAEGLEKDAA